MPVRNDVRCEPFYDDDGEEMVPCANVIMGGVQHILPLGAARKLFKALGPVVAELERAARDDKQQRG